MHRDSGRIGGQIEHVPDPFHDWRERIETVQLEMNTQPRFSGRLSDQKNTARAVQLDGSAIRALTHHFDARYRARLQKCEQLLPGERPFKGQTQIEHCVDPAIAGLAP